MFSGAQLLLISCHNNRLLLFTELGISVVIVPTPMFVLPWVHEKFTVKFTMSNVDGCAIYMRIGCLNLLHAVSLNIGLHARTSLRGKPNNKLVK